MAPRTPITERRVATHPIDDATTLSRLLRLEDGHKRLEHGHEQLSAQITTNTKLSEELSKDMAQNTKVTNETNEKMTEFFKQMDSLITLLKTMTGLGTVVGWLADAARRVWPLVILGGAIWAAFRFWLRDLVK